MAKEILLNNKNLYKFTGDKNHNFFNYSCMGMISEMKWFNSIL